MLQLLVFDPGEDYDDDAPPTSALRVGAYLAAPPSWQPDVAETLLLLDPSIGVSLLPINPFGWLDALAAQLAEAADRLEADQRALLRSSIEATPSWLALEPDGDVVSLSVLAPLPYAVYARAGAATASSADRDAVHAYVDAHRDELRPGDASAPLMSRSERALQDIRLPRAGLAAALRAEARDGRALYQHLRPAAR